MKKNILLILFMMVTIMTVHAQSFPDQCVGTWHGTMQIFSRGILKDSVKVVLTVAKTNQPNEWSWKTEYLSEKFPMTKDYVLRLKDAEKNIYVTDEKNGIELMDYLFHNKLYSIFETQGIFLTSSYELRGKELIFEVTSGKKTGTADQPVMNYSVDNLQRVVFRKSR
ncbi:MAG: hypothetical protein RI909_1610 [Bacteroidota bacterium]